MLIRADDANVRIYLGPKCVAEHRRSWDVGAVVEAPAHRRELRDSRQRDPSEIAAVRFGAIGRQYLETLTATSRSLRRESLRLGFLAELFGTAQTQSAMAARDPKVARAQLRQLLRKPESERIDVAADPIGAVTFRDLAEQWTSGELHERYPDHVASKKRSVRNDVIRLGKLYETIGAVPLVAFTVEHAERAMANLPPTTKASSTRRHYAQLIARVLALAVYPCKILERSPLPRGFLPKVRTNKSFQWLRPTEGLALVTCPDVPFERRVLYWFLAREGCRLSEALALRWRDVAGRVVQLGITKTDEPRTWAMRDDVALGLAALRGSAPDDGRIFVASGLNRAAPRFRADLLVAGVKRPELHERAPGKQPIRLHDLRATFVTLALAAGRSETWVSDRTGHRRSIMINRYRRAARTANELNLGELAPVVLSPNSGTREPQFAPETTLPQAAQ